MKMYFKIASLVMISAFVVFAFTTHADAAWPERPVTVVIQYKAGGGTDTLTRAYTKAMEKSLGVTVNAVNRPGAIGALAMDYVYAKPADGYWWLSAQTVCRHGQSSRILPSKPSLIFWMRAARTPANTLFQIPVLVVSGMREMSFSSRKPKSRFAKFHIKAVLRGFWPASKARLM